MNQPVLFQKRVLKCGTIEFSHCVFEYFQFSHCVFEYFHSPTDVMHQVTRTWDGIKGRAKHGLQTGQGGPRADQHPGKF